MQKQLICNKHLFQLLLVSFTGALIIPTLSYRGLSHSVDLSKAQRTTCLRMDSGRYYTGGMGKGIKWELLGPCDVKLDKEMLSVSSIYVMPNKPDKGRKTFVVDRRYEGYQGLKGYQNPTGNPVICLFENKALTSAICAMDNWWQN